MLRIMRLLRTGNIDGNGLGSGPSAASMQDVECIHTRCIDVLLFSIICDLGIPVDA